MVTSFVLVPGACHGGWWYQPLVEALEARGHVADALTLAGLESEGMTSTLINLDTHIDQVAAAVSAVPDDDGAGIVLVGHSYGGVVISGVADRLADRVRALVYLDAFVPEDGDSCFTMTNDEQREWYTSGSGITGYGLEPLPFFDGRARPHPVATLLQQIHLTGAWRSVPVKHYVAATEWPGESPFAATAERLRSDADWTVHEWATRHNVLHDGPGRVLDLIEPL